MMPWLLLTPRTPHQLIDPTLARKRKTPYSGLQGAQALYS